MNLFKELREAFNLDEHFPTDRGPESTLYKHYAVHCTDDGITNKVKFNRETQQWETVGKVRGSDGDFTIYEFRSPEEYDEAAEILQNTPVRTSDENSGDRVVGYMTSDGRAIKFDTLECRVVIYKPSKPDSINTITYYGTNRSSRYAEMKRQSNSAYYGEIPDGK